MPAINGIFITLTHDRRETEAEGVERMYGAEEVGTGESVDADL